MVRRDLQGVAQPVLPAGFHLRHYRPGDEAGWLEIIRRSYGGHWPNDTFARCVLSDESFRPERLFFVAEERADGVEELVATAGAFQKLFHGDRTGYIHMLAVIPAYRNRGLGAALLRQCLLGFRAQGWGDAVLDTDATRLAAIRLYLAHGFRPFPELPGDLPAWREVLRQLGRADLAAGLRMPAVRNGPTGE